jgi:hypothetical protein
MFGLVGGSPPIVADRHCELVGKISAEDVDWRRSRS